MKHGLLSWDVVLKKKKPNLNQRVFYTVHGTCDSVSGLFSLAYLRNAGKPHLGVVEETVLALQSDQNQDLAFFAALEPKRGNVTDLSMLQEQN